ncbi:Tumor necrosis factor ligand superfamily member 12 [Bienertia sinuspersici]
MKKEMKHAQVNTLEKVDLVFFLVVASGHYYLLCINFMKGSLELIDNRLLDNNISFLRAFATFYATFQSTKNKNMFEEICNFKTKTLKMKWRSNDNYDDCGVYLLKHMQTYHGEKDIEWENGLQLNNVDQIEHDDITKKLKNAMVFLM